MGCHEHIDQSLRLSGTLLEFSSEERLECNHDTCAVLDGVIRDSARRIARAARQCGREVIGTQEDNPEAVNPNGRNARPHGHRSFVRDGNKKFPRKGEE